jgi:hypothetical protein
MNHWLLQCYSCWFWRWEFQFINMLHIFLSHGLPVCFCWVLKKLWPAVGQLCIWMVLFAKICHKGQYYTWLTFNGGRLSLYRIYSFTHFLQIVSSTSLQIIQSLYCIYLNATSEVTSKKTCKWLANPILRYCLIFPGCVLHYLDSICKQPDWLSTACFNINTPRLLTFFWLRVLWNEVKVKLSLCLTNYALCHEGVWRCGCIQPHFLDLSSSWRWVVSFTLRPL